MHKYHVMVYNYDGLFICSKFVKCPNIHRAAARVVNYCIYELGYGSLNIGTVICDDKTEFRRYRQ